MVRLVPTLAWLALLLSLFVDAAISSDSQQKIVIGGAQSLMPLAERFSSRFLKDHPGIGIEFRPGGSNYAVRSTLQAEIDIGLITRGLKDAEKEKLHPVSIGHDAIILLTYPGNSVSNLRLRQLQRIYLGQITNWRQLGGEDKGIVVLTRENTSALHATFIDHVFGPDFKGREQAFVLRASKDKVLRSIKRIEGSIGYGIVRLDEAEAQGVKVLEVEGAAPTPENLAQGTYPLTRPQSIISHGAPHGIIKEWIVTFTRFMNSAATAQP
jgi:phosphate transport system substrate-binding protein